LKQRDKSYPVFFLIIIIAVLLFLFLPTIVIIIFSFSAEKNLSFPMGGFSLKWYIELFNSRQFTAAIQNSALVAIITSLCAGILGTVASFALNKNKFKLKNALGTFYMIPITLPGLILGVAILSLFTYLDARLSLITIAISHIVFCIPFVLLIMNSRLEKLDFTIEEAARDLGANPFTVFLKVTFPMIRSSLFGAVLVSFALSFDEFVVTFFTAGAQKTLPLLIWGMMRLGVSPVINAASSMVIVVSFILIIVSFRVLKVNINF